MRQCCGIGGDWLEREGLAPPASWADLAAVGRHFKQARVRRRHGLGPYPLSFVGGRAGGETTTYQLLPFLWAAGGSLIENAQVTLDSLAVRQALAFLQDLVHVERLASVRVTKQAWNGAALAFAQGDVALAFGGTYERFLIRDAAGWDSSSFEKRVAFVPLPQGPMAGNPTLVGGMAYGVFRQTRHPQLALGLLQLALRPEVLRNFSLRSGQHTAHVGVGALLRAGSTGCFVDAAGLFAGARSRPATPAYDRLSLQFQELVELCLAKGAPVDVAVGRAAERVSGITGLPLALAPRAA
jgi:ABC-type glycerol-3-phosphate transport system substrate-binding protein